MVENMTEYSRHSFRSSSLFIALAFVTGLVVGGLVTAYIAYTQITTLESNVASLQNQVSRLSGNQTIYNETITIYQNGTSLKDLYDEVKDSVVLIRAENSTSASEGSGFVFNYTGTMVVITNNHVVYGATSVSVTFSDGNGYAATVKGSDPYSDLAVVTADAPSSEFKPLEIVSSSTLRVGDMVIAIGNPYGLVGSMTTGIVSALGRSITEEQYIGRYRISNIIQTSVLINPGNSGGPLLNAYGKVVGITTAIVQDSQGLAFAIPSDAILKEIAALVETGSYTDHSYLGVAGVDMDYDWATQNGVNVTYGWRIAEVTQNGPAYDAGIQVNDIIIGINDSRMRNGDEITSYLEESTVPNEIVVLSIVRGTETTEKSVKLGTRPPP
jgi:putative serine protease PepD